jgi:hypothetical protein
LVKAPFAARANIKIEFSPTAFVIAYTAPGSSCARAPLARKSAVARTDPDLTILPGREKFVMSKPPVCFVGPPAKIPPRIVAQAETVFAYSLAEVIGFIKRLLWNAGFDYRLHCFSFFAGLCMVAEERSMNEPWPNERSLNCIGHGMPLCTKSAAC